MLHLSKMAVLSAFISCFIAEKFMLLPSGMFLYGARDAHLPRTLKSWPS